MNMMVKEKYPKGKIFVTYFVLNEEAHPRNETTIVPLYL